MTHSSFYFPSSLEGFSGFEAQSLEEPSQGTKTGERRLEQIGAYEGCEQQPVGTMNPRQQQADENKTPRKCEDQTVDVHNQSSFSEYIVIPGSYGHDRYDNPECKSLL